MHVPMMGAKYDNPTMELHNLVSREPPCGKEKTYGAKWYGAPLSISDEVAFKMLNQISEAPYIKPQ